MPRDKRESLIKRAIEEFFSFFPDLPVEDFDSFIISKEFKLYRVELRFDDTSYTHFMEE